MSTSSPRLKLAHTVIAWLVWSSQGFLIRPPSIIAHASLGLVQRQMISFGGSSTKTTPQFPKDVKEAVSKCREAVQQALGKRISRMDVEFPVGTKFGVEKASSKTKKRRAEEEEEETPSKAVLETSDRELARLFVEMFQPVGGENIAVAFSDERLADLARTTWKGDPGASCRIMSTGRQRRRPGDARKNKKKPIGFAAKLAAEVDDDSSSGQPFALPDGIEVAIFVAPGPKELLVVEKTCTKVGMETLVVLLNARLATVDNFGSKQAETLFRNEFEPVFHLGAARQDVAPGCLLHRMYPSDWMVARKPKVGQPRVIMTQGERPTEEDCRKVYESIEIGDLEKNVESALEKVSSWFN